MSIEFNPNLTPYDIFKLGSFGGTYWRPIKSMFYKNTLKGKHLKYKFNLPEKVMTRAWDDYDIDVNKYKVKVGQTLKEWEDAGWIVKQHPYGWVQWYCEYFNGNRSNDDDRQISRWSGIAGHNGRFKKDYLIY